MKERIMDIDDEILNPNTPTTNTANTTNTVVQDTVVEAKEEVKEFKDVKDSDLPDLRGDNYPQEYISMVNRVKLEYSMLPKFDYNKVYDELSDLSIKSSPTPTLQVLNDEIQRVQAAKDRLSEIFIGVLKSYTFKKRAVDILFDAWSKYSDDKSADKRKGDATFRLSDFNVDFAKVEGLLKACTHILKNLDSVHESLSRRITVIQLTMKLGDLGRGALPDFDYDKAMKQNDLISEDKKETWEETNNVDNKTEDF